MQILNKEEVINKIRNSKMKFAWINTYSDLKLIKLEKEDKLESCFNDLIEGKFFDENREISVMESENDKFSVVEFNEENKDFIEEKQILNKHKSPFGGNFDKLVIRHYLEYDNEGQSYVSYTKLCGVERGD